MSNWLENLLLFVGALAGMALVAFVLWIMWDTGNTNAEKSVQLQQECIQAGGTYIVRTGCLMPTVQR